MKVAEKVTTPAAQVYHHLSPRILSQIRLLELRGRGEGKKVSLMWQIVQLERRHLA